MEDAAADLRLSERLSIAPPSANAPSAMKKRMPPSPPIARLPVKLHCEIVTTSTRLSIAPPAALPVKIRVPRRLHCR